MNKIDGREVKGTVSGQGSYGNLQVYLLQGESDYSVTGSYIKLGSRDHYALGIGNSKEDAIKAFRADALADDWVQEVIESVCQSAMDNTWGQS